MKKEITCNYVETLSQLNEVFNILNDRAIKKISISTSNDIDYYKYISLEHNTFWQGQGMTTWPLCSLYPFEKEDSMPIDLFNGGVISALIFPYKYNLSLNDISGKIKSIYTKYSVKAYEWNKNIPNVNTSRQFRKEYESMQISFNGKTIFVQFEKLEGTATICYDGFKPWDDDVNLVIDNIAKIIIESSYEDKRI